MEPAARQPVDEPDVVNAKTPRLLSVPEVVMERGHRSIGEVLSLLKEEFADVTISKIRFLEAQGLIDPERTPSGYRRFYPHDVARLRWVLRQQRENFLPLKVIKERLQEMSDDDVATDLESTTSTAARVVLPEPTLFADRMTVATGAHDRSGATGAAAARAAKPERARASRPKPTRKRADQNLVEQHAPMVAAELARSLDLSEAFVIELERYGLITGSLVGNDMFFDGDALQVTRVAAAFASFGIDARHLRMYKMSVEREMSVFEQVLVPMMRDRDPQRAHQVDATLHELIELGDELRDVLLARASRPFR
ncbi:MAG: MerR family transcriptional regulator [Acidimicrobiales bacterium]